MRSPAAAPTAAMLEAALPVEASAISFTPCRAAKAATSQDARSLYEPEGLQVSSLSQRPGEANCSRNRRGAHSGVDPTGMGGNQLASTGRGIAPAAGSPSQSTSSTPASGRSGICVREQGSQR